MASQFKSVNNNIKKTHKSSRPWVQTIAEQHRPLRPPGEVLHDSSLEGRGEV